MAHALTRTGTTPDNKPVVDFFQMVSSRGMSFEDVLDALKSADMVPCWVSFWMQAMIAEWGRESTLLKLEVAIQDVYGTPYFQEWDVKNRALLAHLDSVKERA